MNIYFYFMFIYCSIVFFKNKKILYMYIKKIDISLKMKTKKYDASNRISMLYAQEICRFKFSSITYYYTKNIEVFFNKDCFSEINFLR